MRQKQQSDIFNFFGLFIFSVLLLVMVYSGYVHEAKTKVPVVDHLQVKNYFVEISLGLLCLLWGGVTLFKRRLVIFNNLLGYGLFAMAGLAIASLVWSVFTGHTVTKLFLWFGAAGYIFLFYQTVDKEKQLDYILMGIFWAAFVSSFIGWGQYLFDWQLVAQAATPSSTFGNKNMACHMSVLGLPTALYFLLGRPQAKWLDWLYALGSAVIIAFLFYTTTRGAWLSVGVELLILIFCVALSGWRYLQLTPNKIAATVGTVLIFAFMAHLKPNYTALGEDESALYSPAEVVNIVAGEAERAAESAGDGGYVRFVIWRGTWDLVKEKPILGYGLGTFFYAYPDKFWVGAHGVRYAHNEFLEFMVELGFVGFTLLMFVMLVSFYFIFRLMKATDDKYRIMIFCILAGLVGTAVNSFFSFPYQHIPPYVMVAGYLFLLMALYEWKIKGTGEAKTFSIGQTYDLPMPKTVAVVAPLAIFSVFMISMNMLWQSKIDQMNDNIWSVMRKTGPWKPVQLPKTEWQQLPNYNWIFQGAATGYGKYPEISFNAAKTLHNAYPRNYIINTLLFSQYMKKGKRRLAKKHIDQAIAMSPRGSFQPEFMKVERLLLPEKKYAEANAILERVTQSPKNELEYAAGNYASLGSIYMKMKDKEKTIKYFSLGNDVFTKISAEELDAIKLGELDLKSITLDKLKHWTTSQNLAVGYKTFGLKNEMNEEWARTRVLKILWQTLSKNDFKRGQQVFIDNAKLMNTHDLGNEPVIVASEIIAIEGYIDTQFASLSDEELNKLRDKLERLKAKLF